MREPRAKRIVLVSYAINGRGMGHLVRQLAIIRQARRLCAMLGVALEPWVLTTSEADTLARREGVLSLKIPSKAMIRDAGLEPSRFLAVNRAWVLNAISSLQPDLLIADTFPGGSFGELTAALELVPHRALVARAVRDEVSSDDGYRALLPLYHRVVVPDGAGTGAVLSRERDEVMTRAEARKTLGIAPADRAVYLTLGGGGDAASAALPGLVDTLVARGWHVVVGAGPLYRGAERRGPRITWLERYQMVELFAGLDAAVSAAGYNTWSELMHHGVPTVFWPQPRLGDDQDARARLAESAGAARIATSVAQIPDLLEHPGDPAAGRALVPGGGALAAAKACLSLVLPADDLHDAAALLTPDARRLLDGLTDLSNENTRRTLALYRFLSGGTPGERRAERAAIQDLVTRGWVAPNGVPEPEAPDLRARLARLTEVAGLETGLHLLGALHKKFPAATAADLLAAADLLFRTWEPFDDWMGAVALVRALPIQRGTYTLPAFAQDMARWLQREEDLFTALGHFSRLEALGTRTVPEVLRALSSRSPE